MKWPVIGVSWLQWLIMIMALLLQSEAYPSEQIQQWHKALQNRLFTRNRRGELSSFPFCRNNKELPQPSEVLSEVAYLDYLRKSNASVLTVNFDVDVSQVVEVNERQRVLTLKLLVTYCWVDCRITWSLDDFPIEQIHLSSHYLRKLDFFVPHVTMLEELEHPSSEQVEYIAEIWSSYIALSKRYTTTVSCNIDVSMYPLDVQLCNLTFESMLERTMVTLTLEQLAHTNSSQIQSYESLRTHLSRYLPNDAWEVRMLPGFKYMQNSCLEYENADDSYCALTDTVTHTLLLRRHPTYQLVSLMFPAFLIVLISGCVFLIPPGTSDKMALSLSSMLSLFIFTNIMYDKMPETGETLPLLSQYFLSSVALVGLSCLASSVSVMVERSVGSVPVKWLSLFTPSNEDSGSTSASTPVPDSEPGSTSSRKKWTELEMKRLAKIFDRVFFIFHLLASIIILVVYLLYGYIPWRNYAYITV